MGQSLTVLPTVQVLQVHFWEVRTYLPLMVQVLQVLM